MPEPSTLQPELGLPLLPCRFSPLEQCWRVGEGGVSRRCVVQKPCGFVARAADSIAKEGDRAGVG